MNLHIVIAFHMPATQVPPIFFFLRGPVQSKLELENWEKTVDIEWKTSIQIDASDKDTKTGIQPTNIFF